MADIVEELVRYWTAMDSRLDRVHATRWGAVVTDRRFPDVRDANYARVETADPTLSLDEVMADLEPALEAAGAAARHAVFFRPDAGASLIEALAARGDRVSWDVVMSFGSGALPEAPGAVEELTMDDRTWDRIGASRRWFGVTETEVVAQLVRLEREVLDPGTTKRWFGVRGDGGEILALGALVLLAGLGYVDDVVTFPEARGRGLARAVVARLLREARVAGVRRTFLLVDPDGPTGLYEGLGFREATRIASTLAPRQLAGGGR